VFIVDLEHINTHIDVIEKSNDENMNNTLNLEKILPIFAYRNSRIIN